MNIQSWMIKSWATLECYLPPDPNGLPRFKHASTQVRDDGSTGGMRAGDTVWVAKNKDWLAGLAWEWVEARPGVLMLADPNSIISNLALVDRDRRLLTGLKKIVAINQLVHGLAWQKQVGSQLQPSQQLQPHASNQVSSQTLSPHWALTFFHNSAERVNLPVRAATSRATSSATSSAMSSATPHPSAPAAQRRTDNAVQISRSRVAVTEQSTPGALPAHHLRRAA